MNNLKTKHGLFFGFAVIALAAIFSLSLAGCDNGTGTGTGTGTGNGTGSQTTATIKMAAVTGEANTFTLTLTGATWKALTLSTYWIGMVGVSSASDSGIFITGNKATSDGGNADSVSFLKATFTPTSNTVLTVKLEKNSSYTPPKTWKGTIALKPDTFTAGYNGDAATYGTSGAYFLSYFTKEGQLSGNKYLGTLTVAEGSATVDIDTTN